MWCWANSLHGHLEFSLYELLLFKLQENFSLATHDRIQLLLHGCQLYPERLSQALFVQPHCPLVQGPSADTPRDKKKRGQGVHIAATAGPPPNHHHPSATDGLPSQETSTTSSDHYVLGKHESAKRFVATLHSMSAGEWLSGWCEQPWNCAGMPHHVASAFWQMHISYISMFSDVSTYGNLHWFAARNLVHGPLRICIIKYLIQFDMHQLLCETCFVPVHM